VRFIVLIVSVVVQLCLGRLYAWSTFVPPLKYSYGLSTAQTQIVFGGLIAVFAIVMIYSGRVLESKGPRPLLMLSGLMFLAGYGIASVSGRSFWILFLGISVILGAATGLGYVCPLSVCMRWFPTHKGLVTGISVAGFGGGAVLLSSLAEAFLIQGTDVLVIFRWVGVFYGLTIMVAGLVVRFPGGPSGKVAASVSMHSFAELCRDPFFLALLCAMFAGTFAGLLVIGNLMPMGLASGLSPSLAAASVSAFAIGNAAGRIAWGRIADKLHSISIGASLLFLALALIVFWATSSVVALFIVTSFLVGFGFGASFVIHAALVASEYGVNRVGNVYPLVFLGYGVAAITGPALGGWLYDFTQSYSPAVGISIAVVILGLLLSTGLIRHKARARP
jgi:OFA family oxalate/formate antiporter-like MFS transporter